MLIPSLFTSATLLAVYRLTVNFTNLPYYYELRRPNSEQFLRTSQHISDAFHALLSSLPGQHNISVLDYRYQQVIGTLVTIEIRTQKADPEIRKVIEKAIRSGRIGRFAVGMDGFEYYTINEPTVLSCSSSQFRCRDGTKCIRINQRCDGKKQCNDGSDEEGCHRKAIRISMTSPYAVLLPGDSIRISAKVTHASTSHNARWLHNNLPVVLDNAPGSPMIRFYRTAMKHYLLIDNITSADAGIYELDVDGTKKGIRIDVQTKSNGGEIIGKQCFNGNNCTVVKCATDEYLCQIDNFCLPRTVICNGQRDCTDTADEANCNAFPNHGSKKLKRPTARPTVKCPDGSTPEFSLHGSTYCWSNSVCPPDTACIQAKCCKPDPTKNARQCPITSWECGSGECVSLQSRCDGFQACRDGSDEMHCGSEKRSILDGCGTDNYKCDSGDCIPREKACDRHYDCADGSDELKCEYFVAALRAHSGRGTATSDTENSTDKHPKNSRKQNQKSKSRGRKVSHKRQSHYARNGNGNAHGYGYQNYGAEFAQYGYPSNYIHHSEDQASPAYSGYGTIQQIYPTDNNVQNRYGARNGNRNRQTSSYGQPSVFHNNYGYAATINNGYRRDGHRYGSGHSASGNGHGKQNGISVQPTGCSETDGYNGWTNGHSSGCNGGNGAVSSGSRDNGAWFSSGHQEASGRGHYVETVDYTGHKQNGYGHVPSFSSDEVRNGQYRTGPSTAQDYGSYVLPTTAGQQNGAEIGGQSNTYVLPPAKQSTFGHTTDYRPPQSPPGPPAPLVPSISTIKQAPFDNHIDSYAKYGSVNGKDGYEFTATYGETGIREEARQSTYTTVIDNEISPPGTGYTDECSDQEFRCPYLETTICVHYEKLCDGVDDCGDGSDEASCTQEVDEQETPRPVTIQPTPVSESECEAHQFQCDNRKCIPESDRCDRKYDCDDGSDETTCDYFKEAIRQAAEAAAAATSTTMDANEIWDQETPVTYATAPMPTATRGYSQEVQEEEELKRKEDEQDEYFRVKEEYGEHERREDEQRGYEQEEERRRQEQEEERRRQELEEERRRQELEEERRRQELEEERRRQELEEERRRQEQEEEDLRRQELEEERRRHEQEEIKRQEEERRHEEWVKAEEERRRILEEERRRLETVEQEEHRRREQEEQERQELESRRQEEARIKQDDELHRQEEDRRLKEIQKQHQLEEEHRRYEEEERLLGKEEEESRRQKAEEEAATQKLEADRKAEEERRREYEKYVKTVEGVRIQESEERQRVETEWRSPIRGDRVDDRNGARYTDANIREQYEVVEAGKTCDSTYQYQCVSGECIDISAHCDGRTDCSDGSDEMLCHPDVKKLAAQQIIVTTAETTAVTCKFDI